MLLCLGAALGMFFVPPIPQNIHYHLFADQRTILHIPNFWNVMSNLPFLVIGWLGCWRLRKGVGRGGKPELLWHYRIFFMGVFLTGLGSGYYHLAPDNQSLVWDRLPMTIAFMAFFSALVGEFISVTIAKRLLLPLLALGFLAVGYWYVTELQGRGDLRLYVLVQFLPILITPYILLVLVSPWRSNRALWLLVGCYVFAKVLEASDYFWFSFGELISGHSLKHLSAALATYWMLYALRYRQPIA